MNDIRKFKDYFNNFNNKKNLDIFSSSRIEGCNTFFSIIGSKDLNLELLSYKIRRAKKTDNVYLSVLRKHNIIGNSYIFNNNYDLMLDPNIYPKYLTSNNVEQRVNYFKSQVQIAKSNVFFEKVYVISNPHSNHYGHFLFECLPAIFSIQKCYLEGYRFPIYVGFQERQFVKNLIKLIIPDADVIPNSKNLIVETDKIYIPNQNLNIYPQSLVNEIRSFLENLKRNSKQIDFDFKKIFISRSEIKTSSRYMLNQKNIEKIAKNFGYAIFNPEKLSFSDQMILFSNAQVIIGEFGSGLHNSIFSQKGTIIYCLNWLTLYQNYVCKSFDQHLIFQMPKSGYKTTRLDLGRYENFEIDEKIFSNCLNSIDTILNERKII